MCKAALSPGGFAFLHIILHCRFQSQKAIRVNKCIFWALTAVHPLFLPKLQAPVCNECSDCDCLFRLTAVKRALSFGLFFVM